MRNPKERGSASVDLADDPVAESQPAGKEPKTKTPPSRKQIKFTLELFVTSSVLWSVRVNLWSAKE